MLIWFLDHSGNKEKQDKCHRCYWCLKCIVLFILAILPSVGSIAVLVLVNVVSAIRDVLARRRNFFTFYAYFVTFKYFGFVYLLLLYLTRDPSLRMQTISTVLLKMTKRLHILRKQALFKIVAIHSTAHLTLMENVLHQNSSEAKLKALCLNCFHFGCKNLRL